MLVALIVGIAFSIVTLVFYMRARNAHSVDMLTRDKIIKVNSRNADKLMIVAHPDDDALWGGAHLMEGGWLVVCITNGRNETRSEEFYKVIEASGNTPLILEYPDKVNFKRDNWDQVIEGIKCDVSLLVGYKKWTQIATHNPEGEYGHIHHNMTSPIVAQACIDHGCEDKLWYFARYFTKTRADEVTPGLVQLSDEQVDFKKYLLSFYKSQRSTTERFMHTVPYENWIKATDWRDED